MRITKVETKRVYQIDLNGYLKLNGKFLIHYVKGAGYIAFRQEKR